MNHRTLFACLALATAHLPAQLVSPNATGDAIGHIHLNVKDIGAQLSFWTQVGGTPVNNEKLQMIQFPGIYLILRKQDSTGGSVGSVINHFGFHVQDVASSVAKWKAAGLNVVAGANPKQAFLTAPDDIRVEILEDSSIRNPVEMHHIHLFVPDPTAAQAWYVKNFGAVAGKRARFDTANVPGAEIAFEKVDMPQIPSKGRSVDHIGFEVSSIDEFIKKLEIAGIQIESPIHGSANSSKLRIAYITDPWGTYIELTEGLAPAKIALSAARNDTASRRSRTNSQNVT